MRDIHRLERLVLDAIEQSNDPTMREVVAYVSERRRVWLWTHAGILIALIRLEGQGKIEARRMRGHAGEARWIYRPTTEEGNPGERCRACSSSSSSSSEPGDTRPGGGSFA